MPITQTPFLLALSPSSYLTVRLTYVPRFGLDIEVPGASILSSFGFRVLDLWKDVGGLVAFAVGGIVLAYGGMWALLVERR
jgi:hypothetical protein